MSYKDKTDKKLNVNQASKIVKEMVRNDSECIIFRSHGINRIKQRGMNHRDVINVFMGGRCTAVELHSQSGLWVYRFETNNYRIECNIYVYKNIVVITAINKGKG